MGRVAAQGDIRPMAASREAMDDLRRILAGRAAFYSKADLTLDTSAQAAGRRASPALRALVRRAACGDATAEAMRLDTCSICRPA